MKNNKWLTIAGIVASLGLASAVQAVPITGSVDMSGTATLNNISLGSATAATSLSAVTVGGTPTGSFTGTAGDSVSWSGFAFSGGSASPLWTYTDAGTGYTYKFNLTSDSIVTQNNSFLNLMGSGTLFITGSGSPYDVGGTAGSWSFTISNAGGGAHQNFLFTFANSQTATAPDGGSTVMLLGAALSAFGLLRKKLIA